MKNLVVLLLVLLNIAVLPAQGNNKEIKVTKITDYIYKLFVDEFVNIVAFTGPDGVLMVDSGFKENAAQVKSILKKLGNDDIKYIINTHSDYDHVAGNSELGKNAAIIAHSECRKQWLENLKSPGFPADKKISEKSLPVVTFEEKMSLHFNNEQVEIIYFPGCHTDEDVIVYFKNANIACMGDMIMPGSFPVIKLENGGSVNRHVKNIRKLITMFPGDTKLIVGHGRDSTIEELRAYREMLVETIATVRNAMKAGKTVEEMKKENLLKDWAAWSGTVFKEIDAGMWIETIYKDFSQ